MRFTAWMWEQLEENPTPLGDFCRTCWSDVNNGCASSRFTITQWKEHFELRHKDNSAKLNALLAQTYSSYILSLTEK
jgi:hypothetical protein